jgi:DnaK suppressor protein
MGVATFADPERGGTDMDAIRKRLEQELRIAGARLRQMGGADSLDDLRPVGDTAFADEVDGIQEMEWREIGYATRELLVDRVNRLSSALDRLEGGEYGTCAECGEAIAPARLRVMPEVETCVRCQDRIERYGRPVEGDEVEVGVAEEE